MAKLEARNVDVEYFVPRAKRRLSALKDVNLDIEQGQFVSIVGPSGCGKTTFLNAVDGLLPIKRGRITLDGRDIRGPGRDRAMVFQSPSLLPWRTVTDNIFFGLELQGRRKDDKSKATVADLIRLTGLQGFEHSYPSELSGGMQQRVNLARALAVDPEVLLLDEPFAALDAQTREFMQFELLKIWSAARKTAIFITHQIDEAIYLSDRVVVFTARPGTVRTMVDVDLPRPRELRIKRDSRFVGYVDQIWSLIEEEGRRQGQFTAAP
jgi:ABC-type nitrate/sulfonate/bicarbonate transport system ATPase subunit